MSQSRRDAPAGCESEIYWKLFRRCMNLPLNVTVETWRSGGSHTQKKKVYFGAKSKRAPELLLKLKTQLLKFNVSDLFEIVYYLAPASFKKRTPGRILRFDLSRLPRLNILEGKKNSCSHFTPEQSSSGVAVHKKDSGRTAAPSPVDSAGVVAPCDGVFETAL